MNNTGDNSADNRLIIVSNRLPVSISRDDTGSWQVNEGAGGLVTAMAPVLRDRGGLWVGWPGTTGGSRQTLKNLLNEATSDTGYSFEPVMLNEEEVEKYYYGFTNEILWPLFHDLQTRCNFDPSYWRAYQSVNRKFARTIAGCIINGDHIWIHDYHLMTAAKELRRMGVQSKIGYFLHIPFPSPDLYFKLPWRTEIIEGLLAYDLIGFQTLRDRRNFVQCLRVIYRDVIIRGRGNVVTALINGREVRIGHFPISIDFDEFAKTAEEENVKNRALQIQEELDVTHIVLGIDRLDYTKGIPERLAALEIALEKHPELQGNISLLQLVVPSRVHIPEYQDLKNQIERKVSEINGRYGFPGWTPIHYMFRSIDRNELLAFYQAADVGFITPLKDGMNLVAKEYCAANVRETGVLILSEFAGVMAQFSRGALLVNPYDVEAVAQTLLEATRLSASDRKERMRVLRGNVRRNDIYKWVEAFLASVFVRELKQFPKLIPHEPGAASDVAATTSADYPAPPVFEPGPPNRNRI